MPTQKLVLKSSLAFAQGVFPFVLMKQNNDLENESNPATRTKKEILS